MSLFKLGKKKDEGWDDDAAVEFHNKAPATKPSYVPVVTASNAPAAINDTPGNVNNTPSGGDNARSSVDTAPGGATAAPAQDNISTAPNSGSAAPPPASSNSDSQVETPPQPVNDDPAGTATAFDQTTIGTGEARSPSVQAAAATDAPTSASVEMNNGGDVALATPVPSVPPATHRPKTDDVPEERTSRVPLDRASMQQFLETYNRKADNTLALGKELADYLSDLLPVVQTLNAELLECQQEGAKLRDTLTSLSAELDTLDENAPTVDATLRKLVDRMNEELAKDVVEGVGRVEVPAYGAAAELAGIISTTGNQFSSMIPALEKSRDGALKMLQSLKPESNAFAPTKALADFASNAIDSIDAFLDELVALRRGFVGSLDNYDQISESYWRTLAESEVNLSRITELEETLQTVSEGIRQYGESLRSI